VLLGAFRDATLLPEIFGTGISPETFLQRTIICNVTACNTLIWHSRFFSQTNKRKSESERERERKRLILAGIKVEGCELISIYLEISKVHARYYWKKSRLFKRWRRIVLLDASKWNNDRTNYVDPLSIDNNALSRSHYEDFHVRRTDNVMCRIEYNRKWRDKLVSHVSDYRISKSPVRWSSLLAPARVVEPRLTWVMRLGECVLAFATRFLGHDIARFGRRCLTPRPSQLWDLKTDTALAARRAVPKIRARTLF